MAFSTSKGRSFDHSGIYLFEPVYGYGQLYMELAKGRKEQHLKFTLHISSIEDKCSHVRTLTKSVSKELPNYYSDI